MEAAASQTEPESAPSQQPFSTLEAASVLAAGAASGAASSTQTTDTPASETETMSAAASEPAPSPDGKAAASDAAKPSCDASSSEQPQQQSGGAALAQQQEQQQKLVSSDDAVAATVGARYQIRTKEGSVWSFGPGTVAVPHLLLVVDWAKHGTTQLAAFQPLLARPHGAPRGDKYFQPVTAGSVLVEHFDDPKHRRVTLLATDPASEEATVCTFEAHDARPDPDPQRQHTKEQLTEGSPLRVRFAHLLAAYDKEHPAQLAAGETKAGSSSAGDSAGAAAPAASSSSSASGAGAAAPAATVPSSSRSLRTPSERHAPKPLYDADAAATESSTARGRQKRKSADRSRSRSRGGQPRSGGSTRARGGGRRHSNSGGGSSSSSSSNSAAHAEEAHQEVALPPRKLSRTASPQPQLHAAAQDEQQQQQHQQLMVVDQAPQHWQPLHYQLQQQQQHPQQPQQAQQHNQHQRCQAEIALLTARLRSAEDKIERDRYTREQRTLEDLQRQLGSGGSGCGDGGGYGQH